MGQLKRINPNCSNIEYAEEISKKFATNRKDKEKLTNTKLRNLFSLLNKIYNKIYYRNITSLEEIINDLEYLKVRFIYEASRDKTVKQFIEEAKLRAKLDEVIKDGTLSCFIDFCHYFEAYVSYIKYYEGE